MVIGGFLSPANPPPPPPPPVAAVVDHLAGTSASSAGGAPATPFTFTHYLPNLSVAGNAIVISVVFSSNVTWSATDNVGNTYTATSAFDSGVSWGVGYIYCINPVAGARKVTITASATLSIAQFDSTQLRNVVSAGTFAHNSGTSAAPSVGSAPAAGTIAIATCRTTVPGTGHTFTGSGSLENADSQDARSTQVCQAGTAPSWTLDAADTWIAGRLVLNVGAQGSARTGQYFRRILVYNLPVNTTAGGSGSAFANPVLVQAPCTVGTALCFASYGGHGHVTTITDTQSNTWTAGPSLEDDGVGSGVGFEGAGIMTCGTVSTAPSLSQVLKLTVTFGGHASPNANDQTLAFVEMVGVTQTDQSASSDGDQTATGSLHSGLNITPSVPNTLVISVLPIAFNTITGVLPGAQLSGTYDGQNISGPSAYYENNGLAVYTTISTATFAFIWSVKDSSTAIRSWIELVQSFK